MTYAKPRGATAVFRQWTPAEDKLGLPCGVPDGFEYLTHAAERTGYERSSLMLVLRWAGVKVHRCMSRPIRGAAYRFHFVDPLDVDDAIAAWHETETLEAAARRLNVCAETLRRRLRAIGVDDTGRAKKAHWRIRSADIDRAVAA